MFGRQIAAYINYVLDPMKAFRYCSSDVITEQCVAVRHLH